MKPLLFCLLLGWVAPQVLAQDPLAAIKQGQPRDVARLIDRMYMCHHILGEEMYDDDRKREIMAIVEKLKCATVERDQARVLKRYHRRHSVAAALARAANFITGANGG